MSDPPPTPSRPPPRVVLASTSRYRRELIARLGLARLETAAPDYDEEAAKDALVAAGTREAGALVMALAEGKARSLAARYPRDAVILGSDQAAEVDGDILGKPGTPEAARAQLARLAGRAHRLLTAVVAYEPATGRLERALDTHVLAVRPLTAAQIADYVARDAPLDCAGAYRVESLGIALFERVEGADFTAVIGLPLTHVVTLLERLGVRVLG